MNKRLFVAPAFLMAMAFNQNASAGVYYIDEPINVADQTVALPPIGGGYIGPRADYVIAGNTYTLIGLNHHHFTNVIVSDNGVDQFETFNSVVTAQLFGPGIAGHEDVTLTGVVNTKVSNYNSGNRFGTFDTEILSMSLCGMTSVGNICEGIGSLSTGQTTITNLGGGIARVTSYFVVNSSVTVNGSGPFNAVAPTLMTFHVPEPPMTLLMGLGVGLLGFFRKKKS